jgi:hypothetical protein
VNDSQTSSQSSHGLIGALEHYYLFIHVQRGISGYCNSIF